MTARLRHSHIVLAALGSALATITACSSPDTAAERDAPKDTQPSSVIIDLKSANGDFLGTCSGTLIGPKMVVTAGHCIAGAKSWSITSSAGKATGTVASTPWKKFGSDLSHPEHSDVGLILLSSAIKLDSYPELATKAVKDGAKATRFHREIDSAKDVVSTAAVLKDGTEKGFKLNYLLTVPKGESFVDTGGAVLDSSGKIVGVVSGRGKTSNMLHVARVDGFSNWSKTAVACSNSATTKTWGGGNEGNGDDGYGGTPDNANAGGGGGPWGGGGGSPWGGGGGGASGGWGGGASSGGWGSSSGGYGGGGGVTTNGAGAGGGTTNPSSTVPGSSGTPGSTTTSGSGAGDDGDATNTNGNGNGTGTPTKPGATTGTGTGESPDAPNTCPGIPACSGADCGDGSNGNNGGTGTGTAPGTDHEDCAGSGDNSETCPTTEDSASCSGGNCGGCGANKTCEDNTIDYGGCSACDVTDPGTGNPK